MASTKGLATRLIYAFGRFQLDPGERRLLRDGHDLRLPPKVFETLVLLVERHSLLVEKDELMKHLWPGTFVEEVTLARNISLLRKALGDPPGQDESQYISTVSKRGYRFIAPVTEIPSSPDGAETTAPDTPGKRWNTAALWITLAAVVAMIGVGAFLKSPPGESLTRPRSGVLRRRNGSTHLLVRRPQSPLSPFMMGRAYELNRQWPEALAAYERLQDGFTTYYWHGAMHVSAVTGDRQRADAFFAQFREAAKHGYISPVIFAEYYAGTGDRDHAIEWLETAYRERASGLIDLEVNFYFDNLRSDPRFQDLERRIGFR